MKNIILIISFIVCPFISAQTKYTLSDCINMALNENIDIKRQRVQVDKQDIQTATSKLSLLPNLNLDGQQKFDFGRSLNRTNSYEDQNSQTSVFQLSSEMNLFTGFKTKNTIAQQRLESKISREALEKVRNDVSLQVATYYYQTLLNREVLNIAKEQIELTQEQLLMTEILAQHGKVAESQILDVKAQLADEELTVVKAENTLRLSIIDLAQLLEIRETADFDIVDIKIDSILPLLSSPEDIYTQAVTIMPEIRKAKTTIASREKAVGIAKADFYPTLALAAGLNSNYYHYNNIENERFNSQFKNNLQKTVYLTLRIPLFNRMATRNAVRSARKDLEDSRLAAEDAQKVLYKEIQKTWNDALSARERYESTLRSVAANSEALRYAKEKYAAGKCTVYEYNEAKMKFANSRSEQMQAKYEFALQKRILDFYAGISLTTNN